MLSSNRRFTAVFPKASAKVILFPGLTKFFSDYFQKIMHFLGLSDESQGKTAILGGYEQDNVRMGGEKIKPNSA